MTNSKAKSKAKDKIKTKTKTTTTTKIRIKNKNEEEETIGVTVNKNENITSASPPQIPAQKNQLKKNESNDNINPTSEAPQPSLSSSPSPLEVSEVVCMAVTRYLEAADGVGRNMGIYFSRIVGPIPLETVTRYLEAAGGVGQDVGMYLSRIMSPSLLEAAGSVGLNMRVYLSRITGPIPFEVLEGVCVALTRYLETACNRKKSKKERRIKSKKERRIKNKKEKENSGVAVNENDEFIDPTSNAPQQPPSTQENPVKRVQKVCSKRKLEQPNNPAKIRVTNKEFFQHLSGVICIALSIMGKMLYDAHHAPLQSDDELSKSKVGGLAEQLDLLLQEPEFVEPRLPNWEDDGEENEVRLVVLDGGGGDDDAGLGCKLYLAESSIPGGVSGGGGGGLGLFAGSSFLEGDIVIPGGRALLFGDVMISSYLPYLRHHHLIHNIQQQVSSSSSSTYIATRPIEMGDELFFNHDTTNSAVASAHNILHPNHPPSDSKDITHSPPPSSPYSVPPHYSLEAN